MSSQDIKKEKGNFLVVAAIVTSLLIFVLVVAVSNLSEPQAEIDETRIAERQAAYSRITAEGKMLIQGYDWVNQDKGIVRIPVTQAKELVIKQYQQSK